VGLRPPPVRLHYENRTSVSYLKFILRMFTENKGTLTYLQLVSCSEKCGVKGRKTGVHNPDKLEEACTPYVWRITLVPLVYPIVRAWPQRSQGHLSVIVG